jgi:hypothetical protein
LFDFCGLRFLRVEGGGMKGRRGDERMGGMRDDMKGTRTGQMKEIDTTFPHLLF